jgi:hypothetical protein
MTAIALSVCRSTLSDTSMAVVRDVRWCRLSEWLTGTRIYRKVSEVMLRAQSRLRLSRLESCRVERSQLMSLQCMLHKARATRFGQEHDFRRIGSIRDYQRLVPLSTLRSLWLRYWQPAVPEAARATWPETGTQLASLNDGDSTLHLPFSPSLGRAHWKALRTSLALLSLDTRQHLGGDILFLGPAGSRVDAMLATGATPLLSSRIRLGREGRPRDPDKVDEADTVQSVSPVTPSSNVSCILSDRDRFGRLLRSLRWQTGKGHVREIWPQLAAVILTSRCTPTREDLDSPPALDVNGIEVRQACLPLEGPIAVEDRRHDGLRVLGDVDTFLEFVPVDELQNPEPTRHTLADVQPGRDYAAAITSPAGLWSCLSGLRVAFARREPWLLSQVRHDAALMQAAEDQVLRAARSAGILSDNQLTALPAPHPQRSGSSVRRRETTFRSVWSRRAGRE